MATIIKKNLQRLRYNRDEIAQITTNFIEALYRKNFPHKKRTYLRFLIIHLRKHRKQFKVDEIEAAIFMKPKIKRQIVPKTLFSCEKHHCGVHYVQVGTGGKAESTNKPTSGGVYRICEKFGKNCTSKNVVTLVKY